MAKLSLVIWWCISIIYCLTPPVSYSLFQKDLFFIYEVGAIWYIISIVIGVLGVLRYFILLFAQQQNEYISLIFSVLIIITTVIAPLVLASQLH